jgi:SAM-dependent methyltransferase
MKRSSPAAERNKASILGVLREELPARGLVLEIASGSGQHATYFADAARGLIWQPSDPDPTMRASIAIWAEEAQYRNVAAPLDVDAQRHPWPVAVADAVFCANMIHISPWAATEGLLQGASAVLGKGAALILYGPFLRDGVPTAPSNLAFDADLRARNPEWGIRRLEAVEGSALQHGFGLTRVIEMPANNLIVVFRRQAALQAVP